MRESTAGADLDMDAPARRLANAGIASSEDASTSMTFRLSAEPRRLEESNHAGVQHYDRGPDLKTG